MENTNESALKQKEEFLPAGKEAIEDKIAKKNDFFADFDFDKLEIDIREMFKSGVHFGHQKARKNPKMDGYVFITKNGINIIGEATKNIPMKIRKEYPEIPWR